MLNRKLSAAFEAWQATAAQMATEAAAMHRAIKKMTNAKLAAAFETWRDLAMWSSALELRASQAVIEMEQYWLEVAFINWLHGKDMLCEAEDVVEHWAASTGVEAKRAQPVASSKVTPSRAVVVSKPQLNTRSPPRVERDSPYTPSPTRSSASPMRSPMEEELEIMRQESRMLKQENQRLKSRLHLNET